MAKKIKEGTFSLEEAQRILGLCYLAEVPKYKEVTRQGRSWGSMGYDPTSWTEKVQDGVLSVWMAPSGLYVEAEI